jgi:hypothetical protein
MWPTGFFEVRIRDGKSFWRIKYIDENPVKAGLSKAPKNIRIARPISGRRKKPAAKAGILLRPYRPG